MEVEIEIMSFKLLDCKILEKSTTKLVLIWRNMIVRGLLVVVLFGILTQFVKVVVSGVMVHVFLFIGTVLLLWYAHVPNRDGPILL